MEKELLSDVLLNELKKKYQLEKKEVKYPILKKSGMTFYLDVYDIDKLGHICVLKMKAMFGLMKMEALTFTVDGKDLPLFNFDYVKAMSKETLIVELYDNMLEELDDSFFESFNKIKEEAKDLATYASEPNWYDSIIYEASLRKTGKKCFPKLLDVAEKYLNAFITKIEERDYCDKDKKDEKVLEFASTLFEKGGPAVNTFKKLFGDEITKKVVIEYMYGQKI